MMESKKTKICIIFTGGTIGSDLSSGTVGLSDQSRGLLLDGYAFRYGQDVEFDVFHPVDTLSENIQKENLYEIVKCIKSLDLSRYDGIVLTHGTDTLVFTASYLSHVLDIDIPVVIVSALYPLTDGRSRGIENLRGAVLFIRRGLKGVYCSYTNTDDESSIYDGRKIAVQELTGDILSVRGKVATLCKDEVIFNQNYEYGNNVVFDGIELNNDIISISSHGLADFNYFVGKKPKAVLISTYHSGTICTQGRGENAVEFINYCEENDIPVVLTGFTKGANIYDSAINIPEYCIRCYDKTFTDSMVLVMLALGQNKDLKEIMK